MKKWKKDLLLLEQSLALSTSIRFYLYDVEPEPASYGATL